MTVKLTIYVDESLKRLIKETSGDRKISAVVSDALESYVSTGSIRDLKLPDQAGRRWEMPSLSEVKSKRPKANGSSAEIIADQRRERRAHIS
jgi:hypothetical protein